MRFERTKGLESPARDEVLTSGLADEDVKPFEAWAYEGDEPLMNLWIAFRVPRGMFAITNKGIMFLTTGKGFSARALSVNIGLEIGKAIGEQTGLLGGVLALGAVWAGNMAVETIAGSDPIRKYLDHPQSFVVPYVDLVEAGYLKGSFRSGRRRYLIVTSEDKGGTRKKYYITPCSFTKGWENMPDLVMVHRFLYEKQAMALTVIRELVPDLDSMRAEALEKYRSTYGDDLAEHA